MQFAALSPSDLLRSTHRATLIAYSFVSLFSHPKPRLYHTIHIIADAHMHTLHTHVTHLVRVSELLFALLIRAYYNVLMYLSLSFAGSRIGGCSMQPYSGTEIMPYIPSTCNCYIATIIMQLAAVHFVVLYYVYIVHSVRKAVMFLMLFSFLFYFSFFNLFFRLIVAFEIENSNCVCDVLYTYIHYTYKRLL